MCLELIGEGCHVLRAMLYLTRLELFVIHGVCQWCVAGAAIMAAALLLTIVRAARLMG